MRTIAHAASAAEPGATVQVRKADRVWVLKANEDLKDVSRDGKFAAYIDWDTGNLYVRDLTTGAVRNLTKKGTYQDTESEAESGLFSPDGESVAFEWWNAEARHDELRIVSLSDGSIRTVLKVPPKYSVWPEVWMPGGKQLIMLLDDSASRRRFELVDIATGSTRTLKRFENFRLGSYPVPSPDGSVIAFVEGRPTEGQQHQIQLLNVKTLRESTILQDSSAGVHPVGWANDERLIFTSERGGSPAVWSVRVVDGKARGEPELIRSDLWHLTEWTDLASGGRMFYEIRAGDRDVYTAAFDAESGRLLSQPVSVTHQPGEDYQLPAWSGDGRSIAYMINRASPFSRATIVIRPTDGQGDVREYIPSIYFVQSFTWVTRQPTLMINGFNDRFEQTLYRYDLRTGTAKAEAPGVYTIPAFSADGATMYLSTRPADADSTIGSRIVARDLASRQDRELFIGPAGLRVDPTCTSADGRTLSMVAMPTGNRYARKQPRGVWSLDTQTGAVRNLAAGIPLDTMNEYIRPMGFAPDQQSFLIRKDSYDHPDAFSLWRAPLDGSGAVRLPGAPAEIRDTRSFVCWLSPDGRRIAFTGGSLSTELWVMEDPRLSATE